MARLALVYIRNRKETIFPVKDINHAIRLANNIAESDLLNDSIDFNCFDVFHYDGNECGDAWESDDGDTFEDVWKIDNGIKEKAEQIAKTLGLDLDLAINIFIKRFVDERGFPFPLTLLGTNDVQRENVELKNENYQTPERNE